MTVNHDVTGSSPVRGAKKKASRKTCFFQWSAPKRMKNEAGLPPMKRAFGTRREKRALHFMRAKLHSNSWVLHGNKVAASYLRSKCFISNASAFFIRSQATDYINAPHWFKVGYDVTTSAMRPSEPHSRHSLLDTLANYISLLCRTPFVKTVINCFPCTNPVRGAISFNQKGNSQKDHKILWSFFAILKPFFSISCVWLLKRVLR